MSRALHWIRNFSNLSLSMPNLLDVGMHKTVRRDVIFSPHPILPSLPILLQSFLLTIRLFHRFYLSSSSVATFSTTFDSSGFLHARLFYIKTTVIQVLFDFAFPFKSFRNLRQETSQKFNDAKPFLTSGKDQSTFWIILIQ